MRAILIEQANSFRIIDIPVPNPAPDEVLIQIKATALCNQHDYKVNHGLYRDLIYLEYGMPGFPGHEGAGVVSAIGNAVSNFTIGDHVVLSGLGGPPLYAEFVTRQADQIVRVKKKVPLEQVAMSELFGCVHRACRKIADYQNKKVVVSGCGAAGLAAIQIIRNFGAGKVIALDVAPARLTLAKELGAHAVVDARDRAAVDELKRNGAEVVIECSGTKTAYQDACFIAREAVVIFGYSEGLAEIPLWPLFDHEITIYNSKWLTTADLTAVVRMIESGKIRTDKMISLRTDFEHYPDAVAKVGRGEVIKAILVPEL